ncbi:reverse transcriptase domain-containing protein [Tanacetum coccineum]
MKTPADENVLSYQKFVKFVLDETKLSTKSLVPSYLQEEFSNLKAVNGKTKLKMCSFQALKIRLLRSLSIESSDGYTEINSTKKQTNEKATTIGIMASTVFYMLCEVLGYIAFGNDAPRYFLTGFGFHDPFWLVDVVNVCTVIHLLGAYQVIEQTKKYVFKHSYYIYPIIVPSDYDVEDAFSSKNTPNYTPASLDYFPATSGNTSSDPSEDLSKDLWASLTISPFYDDPYMKVMQAYNATNNESPIPPPRAPIAPPTVLPPSPVLPLSPMFDPQDFFLLEEILPPQKRARFLPSSSDFSTSPQVFEIGESSHKTYLECHEEQIETILNHLDELPYERVEHMEDKIEGLGNGRREQIRHDDEIVLARVRISTLKMLIEDIQNGATSSMTQAAIRKLVVDSVVAALEIQAATMANADDTNRNTGPRETPVARKCSYKEFMSCQSFNFKVKFATGTLTEEALSLWNSFTQPIGIEEAYKITWSWQLYVQIWCQITEKLMEVFIGGLPRSIEGNVTDSKPQTLEEAITLTHKYTGSLPCVENAPCITTGPCTNQVSDLATRWVIDRILQRNKGPATGSNLAVEIDEMGRTL